MARLTILNLKPASCRAWMTRLSSVSAAARSVRTAGKAAHTEGARDRQRDRGTAKSGSRDWPPSGGAGSGPSELLVEPLQIGAGRRLRRPPCVSTDSDCRQPVEHSRDALHAQIHRRERGQPLTGGERERGAGGQSGGRRAGQNAPADASGEGRRSTGRPRVSAPLRPIPHRQPPVQSRHPLQNQTHIATTPGACRH